MSAGRNQDAVIKKILVMNGGIWSSRFTLTLLDQVFNLESQNGQKDFILTLGK